MSPPLPTDPTLLVPSLDRSSVGLPAVLLGYSLLALVLLARGVKRNWLGRRGLAAPERPDADPDPGDPFPDGREEPRR
ncbi:hypothetical protein [Halorientalis halophila]|uniref:hypothetical protein n=1 Tax=Halorientalis halophila TaxID=3108499 RepID=UPI00300B9D18